jgi:membrane protein DedA with SNARE-associated domain
MDYAELISQYSYWFLFVGMLLAGEVVLIPAIYFSLAGHMTVPLVILVSGSATIVSDLIWYWIGMLVPLQRLLSWKKIARHRPLFEQLTHIFNVHAYRILFLSKFIYGTRILAQAICGIHRLPLWKYLFVNALGVLLYILFLYMIALFLGTVFPGFLQHLEWGLAVFVGIIAVLFLCIRYLAMKKISQS